VRWPDVRVEPRALADGLARRNLEPGSQIAPDVALAAALAAGDRGALHVFERELVPEIRRALAKLDGDGDLIDEALQRVRDKLLVAAGEPRVLEYAGRGPLVAWVQMIAIREALMLRRAARRDAPLDELAVIVETDPALALTKRVYREHFAAAFTAALAALAVHDRTLLRLCFVDAVGTEKLAALYAVHRATMFRWLRDARAQLLGGIRTELVSRTGVREDEVDSLLRALSSLDVGW
jgi:RNA polymerase sigma-70 factor (ECF subfamily)